MRLLLSVLPFTRGDINPYLEITRELTRNRDGHAVFWVSLPEDLRDFAPLVTAAGGVVLETAPLPPAPLPRGEPLARIMSDAALYARRARVPPEILAAQTEHVRALIREHRIDVVATDRILDIVPALLAAEKEGIPHAFVNAGLQLLFPWKPSASAEVRAESMQRWIEIRSLYRRYGLKPYMFDNQITSRTLNTCFTTQAALSRDAVVPPNTELVGPCIAPEEATRRGEESFPWERLRADGRIVYVSFGSLYSDAAVYRLIAEAAAPLDVQIVLSTGPLDGSFVAGLPGDIVSVSHAPQMELLAKVRAFVSHGGLNSVNESLFHGVPLVVIPRAVDQHVQANLVRAGGTGIAFDQEPLTLEGCRAAISEVLAAESTYRDAARRVRDSYRRENGVKTVADRLLSLARATA